MAHAQRPELSSVFDDMLANNRKRFDDLYVGGGSRAGDPFALPRASFVPKPGKAVSVAGSGTGSSVLDPNSAARRRLNERFGDDWRYEIAEQRRDGDEVIVLCKLIFGREGAVRTQFGRANIVRGAIAGASAEVRFKLEATGAVPDEADAFRRATETALNNCADLI